MKKNLSLKKIDPKMQLRFGGNWLHIIFWRIVLEVTQIWRELAPHYFPVDCFGGAQLYCTLSMYVTPKTSSPHNQKTNTTPQLYCTLSTWVCKPKPISSQNQKLTWHNSTTGKKVPPAHVKRVYSFLRLSVCLSVRP